MAGGVASDPPFAGSKIRKERKSARDFPVLQELRKQCVEFIQNKGVEKVTLEVGDLPFIR